MSSPEAPDAPPVSETPPGRRAASSQLPPRRDRQAPLPGWAPAPLEGLETWQHPHYPHPRYFALAAAFRAGPSSMTTKTGQPARPR